MPPAPRGCATPAWGWSRRSRGSRARWRNAQCDNPSNHPVPQGPTMKRLPGFAAFLAALLLALPAAAQDPAAERIKAELKKKISEATVDAVRKVPYGGLYEV